MKVIKLDRRYNGYGTWTHRTDGGQWYGAEARHNGLISFYDMRCYMTQMNGPGCFIYEAGALRKAGRAVPEWAWDVDGNVYFRDSALVNFRLAKDRWQ
jgi:hypothetical protein